MKHSLLLVFMFVILLIAVNAQDTMAGDNTWSPIGLYGGIIEALAIDPNNDTVLYAGIAGGDLYKTTNGGQTWFNVNGEMPSWGYDDIAVDPYNSNIVYASVHQGPLYKSENGGLNWTNINSTNSFAIAIHPLDGNILLFGGWDGGIWRSTDAGLSWEEIPSAPQADLAIRILVFAPSAPHIVYAAGFDGVWRSVDNGLTWVEINNSFVVSPEVWSLAVDPYDSQVVYIGTALDGIYKTVDGGSSWFPIGNGLGSSHITGITINPSNQQLLYVGGGIHMGSGTPGVYRSLDNQGLTWSPMMDGMGSRAIYRLIMDQLNPRNLYAGTIGGVWKYTLVSAPDDYSVSINNGAIFTNQTAVTLNLTAPPGTTQVQISNDGGFGGAIWQAFENEKSWTITEAGDYVLPRTVYVRFKTNGVTSGLYQDDIVLDVVQPSGEVEIITPVISSMSANWSTYNPFRDPASIDYPKIFIPVLVSNAYPGYVLKGLQLSASDDLSGVSEMMISSSSSFAGASWEAFRSTSDWWFAEDEISSVYVKYRDRAGNVSPVYSDTYLP